jgi:DeoR family fructose operon transcriptional repressor
LSFSTNETLFAEERKSQIVALVESRTKVLVPELVDYFKVSPATIRNDLRDLELQGLIKRTHGGAIPSSYLKAGYELDTERKGVEHLQQKQAIAASAIHLVEEGDIIAVDTGTTTYELAKLLKNFKNITIVSNDIDIARYLEECDGINVMLIGGTLRKKFHCTVGPFAAKMLSELNVDKVFLATNGFSMEKGCTTPDTNQAEIKKIMLQIATKVIVLCDSSKIGINSFVNFAPLSEIDVFVTDHKISESLQQELLKQGLEVIVAAP